MKQSPQQLLLAAQIEVVAMRNVLEQFEDPAQVAVTVACYFAMCAELALSNIPDDFLASGENVTQRLAVHEAREFAAQHIKEQAAEAATPRDPEFTPHG